MHTHTQTTLAPTCKHATSSHANTHACPSPTSTHTHLLSHDALLVVLSQAADELQELLALLLVGLVPAVLEALEQVVQLLGREVPGQLGQQLVDVLQAGQREGNFEWQLWVRIPPTRKRSE